jgi:hypothetical protein
LPPTLCVGSITGALVITREQILDKHWTETGQTLDKHWTNTGQRLDKHWTKTVRIPVSDKEMDALKVLAPNAKARRFRSLLPQIEAKIEAGVRHADIIRALDSHGLSLPENTYFTYLRRYGRDRSREMRQEAQARPAHPPSPAASGELPATASQGGENSARRPPTFDFDPRGIPELLK